MTPKSDDRLLRESAAARAVVYALNLLSEEGLARVPLLPESPNKADVDATLSGLAMEFSRMNFEETQQ